MRQTQQHGISSANHKSMACNRALTLAHWAMMRNRPHHAMIIGHAVRNNASDKIDMHQPIISFLDNGMQQGLDLPHWAMMRQQPHHALIIEHLFETKPVTNRYASTYHFINRTMACNRALTYSTGQWRGVNRIMPWSSNTWYETMSVTTRYASTYQHRE